MRALACITSVLGGACWVAGAFLSGSLADAVVWTGIGLLTVTAFVSGLLIAGGSLVALRLVVAVGCVALGWSVVAAVVSEVPRPAVVGVVGALALLVGLVQLVRRPRRPKTVRHVGTHSR